MIDVVDLYKTFPMGGRELVVLNNINLHIQRGELIAIMGASGAGKSTLLHLIAGLMSPTEGDVVIDGADNFPTRQLVNAVCLQLGKPWVYGAVHRFEGQVSVFDPRAGRGVAPCYRCLFPEAPPPGTTPTCEEAGVLGALAGVLGSMMALEAIREIVGFGESLVGRLVMIDARAMRFETLRYARDPSNPLNGDEPTIRDLSGHK